MLTVQNSSGIVPNFSDQKTLTSWRDIFMKVGSYNKAENEATQAHINEKNPGYLWFKKVVFPKIKNLFGDDIGLIFAMYQSTPAPVKLHNDYEVDYIPEYVTGKPYVSMLIPFSVDHKAELCSNTSTVILQPGHQDDLYETLLSHCDPEAVSKYELKDNHVWKTGDLVWWDTKLTHASNNFRKTNTSKESFVIHIYK